MNAGLDKETLDMIIDSIKEFTSSELTDKKLIELDEKDEFPVDIIHKMCGDGLGIHLLFIPEEFGGLDGGAFDVYRVCEQLARVDLGVSTGVLATFLGSDPIVFGGTYEQNKTWMTKIAEEGLLMAYGATEPEAGSDLGALKTTATPVEKKGKIVGYKINGTKQWISNGGYADLYTILAKAPGGPSWFVVEKDAEGFEKGKPEDKHGIRASNTAALSLSDVYVDADRLLGNVEGQGLVQAQLVFGYTRLMVAAFGLGAGWSAMDRAIPYSVTRIQGGTPLSEKQGYTHKLIVPNVVNLEAARSYIEYAAEGIDTTGENLNTEGAIAKYMSTEAGNKAAEDAIQALGGYGYTKEYMVEKYKRDVRITTIYEGTSEIMEMTICRDRWQLHLKTRGQYYHDEAAKMEVLHTQNQNVGADITALALHALSVIMERAREKRLTRNQHILFRLGQLIAYAETAASFCTRAARLVENKSFPKTDLRFNGKALSAMSRVFAREATLKVSEEGLRWIAGGSEISESDIKNFEHTLNLTAIHKIQTGLITDMDFIADVLYERTEN